MCAMVSSSPVVPVDEGTPRCDRACHKHGVSSRRKVFTRGTKCCMAMTILLHPLLCWRTQRQPPLACDRAVLVSQKIVCASRGSSALQDDIPNSGIGEVHPCKLLPMDCIVN